MRQRISFEEKFYQSGEINGREILSPVENKAEKRLDSGIHLQHCQEDKWTALQFMFEN